MPPHQSFPRAEPAPTSLGAGDQPQIAAASFLSDSTLLSGMLHVYLAFDWGEEIDLEKAQKLFPAELQTLARRRRTPASIAYRPPPLRYPLTAPALGLAEIDGLAATVEATVFDFGGVSVGMRVPFKCNALQLTKIAASLSDASPLIEAARAAITPLHSALLPAIDAPHFSQLTEEYFVFQLPPGEPLPAPDELLAKHANWVAALTRLECEPLSDEEMAQALLAHLSYSPDDLFLPDWSAALLIDRDCDETLQVIEFANLQLLEYRFLDDLLDDRLAEAHRFIRPLARSWLPFWRVHDRSLRSLGELKIDANNVFERTGNSLKLVGDQYLARVYQALQNRFHLKDWERSIERSLTVVQDVYRVVSDQAANYRAEFLELIIILLILFEIVMAFVRRG